VNASGKYWRLDYRYASKRKTLALGVYPAVSLAKARQRREKARELLAEDIDPTTAKHEEKQAKAALAVNTFEAVAREWVMKTSATRIETTQRKISTWLEKDVIPYIGKNRLLHLGQETFWQHLEKWNPEVLLTVFNASNRYADKCLDMPLQLAVQKEM
jgi:hypothetical protein